MTFLLDDNAGRIDSAQWVPSPNFGPRPETGDISLLVIHNISLPPGQFGTGCVPRFFCNELAADEHPYFEQIADLQVSSHLLIERTGAVIQFVDFRDRAWHAGHSSFDGRDNCNDYSIGIELEGTDTEPYTDAQYDALTAVTRAIMAAYPDITPARITGHEHIAPGRKTDPGPAFDWPRYRQALVASSHESSDEASDELPSADYALTQGVTADNVAAPDSGLKELGMEKSDLEEPGRDNSVADNASADNTVADKRKSQ